MRRAVLMAWFAGFLVLQACSKEIVELPEQQVDPRPDYMALFGDFETPESCESDDLKPLAEAARLPADEEAVWASQIESLNGDDVARLAMKFADETDYREESFNRNLMYLLLVSAERGSAIGLDEVGAALMYCYQGVQQDDLAAATWLERAVEKHDTTAMYSLGRLHVEGRLGEESSTERGTALLRNCANLGNTDCAARLLALSEPPEAP